MAEGMYVCMDKGRTFEEDLPALFSGHDVGWAALVHRHVFSFGVRFHFRVEKKMTTHRYRVRNNPLRCRVLRVGDELELEDHTSWRKWRYLKCMLR